MEFDPERAAEWISPLTSAEIEFATWRVRCEQAHALSNQLIFVSVNLDEPDKALLLHHCQRPIVASRLSYSPSSFTPRKARVILLDRLQRKTFCAIVDVSSVHAEARQKERERRNDRRGTQQPPLRSARSHTYSAQRKNNLVPTQVGDESTNVVEQSQESTQTHDSTNSSQYDSSSLSSGLSSLQTRYTEQQEQEQESEEQRELRLKRELEEEEQKEQERLAKEKQRELAMKEGLTAGRYVEEFSWERGQHACLTAVEYEDCQELVRNDTRFQQLMRERGITDMSTVMVDVWTAGYGYKGDWEKPIKILDVETPTINSAELKPSPDDDKLQLRTDYVRLGKPLIFITDPGDPVDKQGRPMSSPYARPLRGVTPVVDMDRMKIIRIDVFDDTPPPRNSASYFENNRRPDTNESSLRPIVITQPEGSSFTLENNLLSWHMWSMAIGFNTREGLTLNHIRVKDPKTGDWRWVVYRASCAEMVVPYGDPTRPNYRKNAFDVGEEGLGFNVNSLELGCDCLGEISYMDAVFNNCDGDAEVVKQAICIHEEDDGILWKHTDWRHGTSLQMRARKLVVSFFITVANYDYGFYWYFHMDGTFDHEVKMTGIINVQCSDNPLHSTRIANGVSAPMHQHMFTMRLDMAVDSAQGNNRVYEVDLKTSELNDETNPQGNAFEIHHTLLPDEQTAKRNCNWNSHRYWKVSNSQSLNRTGVPVSYALIPSDNSPLFLHPSATILRRADFLKHHLYVTQYIAHERYPSGEYPNQSPGATGLTQWTHANRPLVDEDVVLWYTYGATHVVRPEDWPVMPVVRAKFTMRPVGFFSRNATMWKPRKNLTVSNTAGCTGATAGCSKM